MARSQVRSAMRRLPSVSSLRLEALAAICPLPSAIRLRPLPSAICLRHLPHDALKTIAGRGPSWQCPRFAEEYGLAWDHEWSSPRATHSKLRRPRREGLSSPRPLGPGDSQPEEAKDLDPLPAASSDSPARAASTADRPAGAVPASNPIEPAPLTPDEEVLVQALIKRGLVTSDQVRSAQQC